MARRWARGRGVYGTGSTEVLGFSGGHWDCSGAGNTVGLKAMASPAPVSGVSTDADAENGNGVYGESQGLSGRGVVSEIGVYGEADGNGSGVVGITYSDQAVAGVLAVALNPSGDASAFDGLAYARWGGSLYAEFSRIRVCLRGVLANGIAGWGCRFGRCARRSIGHCDRRPRPDGGTVQLWDVRDQYRHEWTRHRAASR